MQATNNCIPELEICHVVSAVKGKRSNMLLTASNQTFWFYKSQKTEKMEGKTQTKCTRTEAEDVFGTKKSAQQSESGTRGY